MSRPGRRVAGAGGDGEQADVLGPQAGVGQRGADRVLAQRQRLGAVAAHARPGRPAGDVLGRRVHRGVPAAHPGAEEDPRAPPGRRRSARRSGPPTCPAAAAPARAARCPVPPRRRCATTSHTGSRADVGQPRPAGVSAPAHALEEHRGGRHRHHPDRVGAAGQPAREVDQRRADPAQPQVHAVPGAFAAAAPPGRRAAPGRGCPAADRRAPARPAAPRRSGPAPWRPGCRSPAGRRAGAAGTPRRAAAGRSGDVLEDLAGHDHVRAAVGQRDRRDVGPHRARRRARPPGPARWP